MNKNNSTTANTVTAFTKDICKLMRNDIQKALDEVAQKYGLQGIQMGNITLNSYEFRTTVVAKVNPTLNEELQRVNTLLSENLGYNKNIVGEAFTANGGRHFTVTSIDLKKPKYPIIVEETGTGNGFKFGNERKLNFEDLTIEWKKPTVFF